MKKSQLAAFVAAAIVASLAAAPAFATPGKTTKCTSCHSGGGVTVSAVEKSNDGVTAAYTVSTNAEAWAVFGPAGRVAYGSAAGTVNLSVGTSYTLYGVDGPDTDTGAASMVIAPQNPVEDLTAPTTSSNLKSSYNGTATITFSAVDVGGAGVAATYYSVDGSEPVTGTVAVVSQVGTHTVEFWSVDNAGNTEVKRSAPFEVRAYLKPSVSKPYAPTKIKKYKTWSCYGYLKPYHTAGSKAVKLAFYHKESGKWVLRKTATASVSNYSTYSKYSAKVYVNRKGSWKVKAYHQDAGHPTRLNSSYDYFTAY